MDKNQGRKSDDDFRQGKSDQKVFNAVCKLRREPGSEGHSSHIDDEYQGLGISGVPHEQFKIVRPDRLVNEPGQP